jgi:hypothetical protein
LNVVRRPAATIAIAILAVLIGAGPAGGVAGFGDIEAGRYYTEAVQWMVDNRITTGTSPACFSPDRPVTRGQAAAFLFRMEGEPVGSPPHSFSDVTADWQQDAVSWMLAEGITTGTSPTTYGPDAMLTRGQMAALLHRLAGQPAVFSDHPFDDVTAAWQDAPVAWMSESGITNGTSPTTFSPDLTVTRAQLAAFLHRYAGSPRATIDDDTPKCKPPPIPRVVYQPAWVPFAYTGEITLTHPAERVELIGFHESGHDGSQQMTVASGAQRTMTMESRERGTGSRTAADIAVDPTVEIRSPVTGTVIRSGGYILYCDTRDEFLVIEPDSQPGWEVKMFHISGLRVGNGDRVVAGETVVADSATQLPFTSQLDNHTASPSWPHVHVEVVDPSIPDRPGTTGC